MAQFHLRQFLGLVRCARSGRDFHIDLDQSRRRADANIHAARGGELGLVALVFEHLHDGGEVFVGNIAQLADENARDVAAGEAGLAGDVGLPELVPVRDPRQSGAQITHAFTRGHRLITERFLFAALVSVYATSDFEQHIHTKAVELVSETRPEKVGKKASTISTSFYRRNRAQATATTRKLTHGFGGPPQKRKTAPYNRLTGAIAHRERRARAQKNEVIL
jgi:hypothetical protein